VSGEYDSLSVALRTETAVMLKWVGASQIITYAAADIAEKLTTDPNRTGISL
jgi:delta-aminolevulinic acid dehydratase/porphobilinogen synthase